MEANKEKNFVSAVIYLRNNAPLVTDFIQGLDEALRKYFLKYEIIVVNDSSKDGSADEVRKYAASAQSTISILNMSFCQGVELCMNAGLDLSIGDFVFEFDSVERDWDWSLLFDVYQTSLKGNDIVFTLNKQRNSKHKLFYWLFNKYAHVQHRISDTSFCLITRRGINRVRSLTKTVPFRKALYANCGLEQFTVLFTSPSDLKQPASKSRSAHHSYNSLILFTDIASKFALIMTVVMAFIILAVLVYAIVIFITGIPVEGWTTTILFMGLSFLGLFAIMAVILKYLSLLTNLVFRKQNYVFESIEKLTNQ